MKTVCVFALLVTCLFCTSCHSNSPSLPLISQIESDLLTTGSLANEKLMTDATAGCLQVMKQKGCGRDSFAKPLVLIIEKPCGQIGQRAWKEIWIFDAETENHAVFIMTFRETGTDSASFEIRYLKPAIQIADILSPNR